MLWYNIGEESRHLDEWNNLQNLPSQELQEYKKRIMVHFGYDKKDAPPTTYHFTIEIDSIVLHFCSDASEFIADIDCHALKWSLRKVKDKISRQKLVCHSIYLEQTSDNEKWARCKKLLIPLEDNCLNNHEEKDTKRALERMPQLIFTSTTRASGDNVKYLEINDACIILIYPAWVFVKSFFQNLPSPNIMKRREVANSVQIGDRWYKMNRDEKEEDLQPYDLLKEPIISEETMESSIIEQLCAEYQLRINLVGPRIIFLDSTASVNVQNENNVGKAVTLQLGHLDFLKSIDSKGGNEKTVFIHDLELFTGFADDAIQRGNRINSENSLLYPLCFAAGSTMFKTNDQRSSQCTKWLVADVISMRTAFTDMTLAMDVVQKTLSDYYQEHKSSNKSVTKNIEKAETNEESQTNESVNLAIGGFDLLVVDDSGRHFATAQELVQLSLYGIKYNRCHGVKWEPSRGNVINNHDLKSITRLQLKGFEVVDYLQQESSPFRIVAANKVSSSTDRNQHSRWDFMNKTLFHDFMSWESYSMVTGDWGFSISSSLVGRVDMANHAEWCVNNTSNFVEINRLTYVGLRDDVKFQIREIVLQWNPSMAIALQRFLGRLKKHVVTSQLFSNGKVTSRSPDDEEKRFLRVEFEIEALTLCLNKEHQRRRLMQVTFSDTEIVFERDHLRRLNLHGFIGDVNAWDCDGNQKGQVNILDSNRLVLCVLHDSVINDESKSCSTDESSQREAENQKQNRFLSFQYFCQPSLINIGKEMKANEHVLPHWVIKSLGTDIATTDIDDCLSLTVATVRFNYLRDRTGEIIDYLSNGLPGKGMGATSRAAKGFIQKRIRTHSFLVVTLNAPQIFLPRHRGDEEGIIVSLGNVNVRSWFDEASVEECESIECKDLVTLDNFQKATVKTTVEKHQRFWWRILSISFTELGWRIHTPSRNSSSIINPVDLHLHLRKPPIDKKMSVIVRCKLSYMDLVLSYLDYVLLRHVLNENIMKTPDKKLWDNVYEDLMQRSNTLNNKNEHNVKYAEDARFVRYGESSKRNSLPKSEYNEASDKSVQIHSVSDGQDSCHTLLDFKFSLDGLTLVLLRDDPVDTYSSTIASGLDYDIVSFEVDHVDVAASTNSKGAKSATIKFYQLALFDQGDVGRLAREVWDLTNNSNCHSKKSMRRKNPSAFSAIAEGYDAFDKNETDAVIDENGRVIREPQMTITVDTRPSADVDFGGLVEKCESATVTVACIRMNSMNMNPLIRPLTDISNFLFCRWPIGIGQIYFEGEKTSIVYDKSEHSTNVVSEKERSVHGFQLKLVAHYPRVFLLADESDPTTRALVLRGLAIITTSIIKERFKSDPENGKTHTSVEAQFHSLESYINPQPRYFLENDYVGVHPIPNITDALGIALIEPVTATFNFHQVRRRHYPLSRQMYVNMESVSTTVSFEDIRLIESVISRLKVASENEVIDEEDEIEDPRTKDREEEFFSFPRSFDGGSLDWDEQLVSTHDHCLSITQTNSNEVQQSGVYCGYLPCPGSPENKVNDYKNEIIAPGDQYSVTFKKQTLGKFCHLSCNISSSF